MANILVIDDSRSVHAFLRDCFSNTKNKLFHAMDGKNALDELSKTSEEIQLILLDWEMPVMDGPHTFDEIKKMGFGIPVIMMTSKNSIDDISSMLNAGVSEYIMKPFTKDILFEKIESVLGGSIRI